MASGLYLHPESIFYNTILQGTDRHIYFDYTANYIHEFMRMTILVSNFSSDHPQALG